MHLLEADQLNTYDVLVADDVVFTQAALEAFLAGPTRGQGRLRRRDVHRGVRPPRGATA